MARIRTVKPEFWTSEQIVECSTSARLLFIGLWNFCDDAGRHVYSPMRIKMEVFPADPFTVEQINQWLEELRMANLIIVYETQGKEYIEVTGWHHQKIDKPTIRHPAPDTSSSPRRVVDEPSPPEGKGRERIVLDQFDQEDLTDDASLVDTCTRLVTAAGLSAPADFDWRVAWLDATANLPAAGVALDAYRGIRQVSKCPKNPRGYIRKSLQKACGGNQFESLLARVPSRKWPAWAGNGKDG